MIESTSATFVTTELVPFHPSDQPTDLAPTAGKARCCGPCRLLIGKRGQRRFCIHRRDRAIEAEHLRLGLKQTRLTDPIKRAVPPQQLRSVFWPDSGRARQFVGRVPAERSGTCFGSTPYRCRTSSGPMHASSPPRKKRLTLLMLKLAIFIGSDRGGACAST